MVSGNDCQTCSLFKIPVDAVAAHWVQWLYFGLDTLEFLCSPKKTPLFIDTGLFI